MLEKIRKINGKKLTFAILYVSLIMEILISELHISAIVRYCNDFFIIFIIFFMIKDKFKIDKKFLIITGSIALFFCASIISALINNVNIPLVIWAIRNNFRGIIFLLAIIMYWNVDDLEPFFDKLFKFQILNLILAIYQFAILHHSMDYVGGIFGYGNGSCVNIFNALLISYYLNMYLNKKVKLSQLMFIIISSFIIASIAEEKMTYLFFCVIFIVSILISKFSFRKLLAITVGVIGLILGLILIKYYYPDMYAILASPKKIIEYSQSTYDDGYRLPRIGAFKKISNIFFDNDTLKLLFGLGFGNCETSNFGIFQSDFYKSYGQYNYRWFTHQWIFLEEGYIGFGAFLVIFITILICLIKNYDEHNKYMITMGICNTLCCIITIWYNATLKVDAAYLAYFSLGIGLISIKKKNRKGENDNDT